MANDAMKEWALWYASIGLAVFPLGGKQPVTENGCKAATTDKNKIEEWWSKHPYANIGIATGSASGGLVVIDLDEDEEKDKHGYEVLKEWQQEHGELPETWTSITGRGGYHLFYKDSAINKNKVGLYDGVDIRGEGGYIVAPPSIHPNGRRYEWEIEPSEKEIATVNALVASFLMGEIKAAPQRFQEPETIPEGQRVSTLIKLVGSQRSKGLSTEAIKAAVKAENEARCMPPLTQQELEKEVFPALKRDWRAENPYTGKKSAVFDGGKFHARKDIQSVDARELLSADLPPVIFLVDGLVSQGLGGLSAKSKLGKSWLALQLAVALARGDKFLGFTTKQCGVLYIDLENAPALTQDRLRKILDGRELPKGKLHFWHAANLMGDGFENDLVKFLEDHPDVKLVIVDVFQKVKPGKKQTQTDYEADYEILTKLKQIADKHSNCIMPIYHDRKFVDPTDPFANVLGSTAVSGVSDFMWVLFKEKRDDPEATLAITGRTLVDSRYKLKRNGVKWKNVGDASAVEEARKRREYDSDPLVNTIRRLVRQNGGRWKGRVKEIISSSQYFKGFRIYDSPQKVGRKIKDIERNLEKYDAIHHHEVPHGTAAIEHIFETENPFEQGEVLN